jgi:uncharacterized membrane protein
MLAWLTESTVGRLLQTFLISMVPVLELRAGIPYGVSLGLDYHRAALAAILGNLFPVPIIILFVRQVFAWLRKKSGRLDAWISGMEDKAELKGEKVRRYGALGLVLLVAIPLPGTGAWTGALGASFLNMGFRSTVASVSLGVILAGIIMAVLSTGVFSIIGL